jgi:hypothetical protein
MCSPKANSLRLDHDGFHIIHVFRKKSFRWSDVSNFAECRLGEYGEVVAYTSDNPPLNAWEKINAALLGERNRYLPDTYGMSAEDLLQLMVTRLHAAEVATRSLRHR